MKNYRPLFVVLAVCSLSGFASSCGPTPQQRYWQETHYIAGDIAENASKLRSDEEILVSYEAMKDRLSQAIARGYRGGKDQSYLSIYLNTARLSFPDTKEGNAAYEVFTRRVEQIVRVRALQRAATESSDGGSSF